jgi:hypothetical protein
MFSTKVHKQAILEFSQSDYNENYSRCNNIL